MKEEIITNKSEVPAIDVHSPLKIDESPFQTADSDEESPFDKKNKSFFISGSFIFFALIILVFIVGFFKFFNNGEQKSTIEKKLSAISPTEKPVKLNKKDFVFEVLNGSGKTGEAKRYADILKSMGFEVIKIGNADQDQDKTTVMISEKFNQQSTVLVKFLQKEIKVSSISTDLTGTTASAQLIIGLE